jgi:hypothetical protein
VLHWRSLYFLWLALSCLGLEPGVGFAAPPAGRQCSLEEVFAELQGTSHRARFTQRLGEITAFYEGRTPAQIEEALLRKEQAARRWVALPGDSLVQSLRREQGQVILGALARARAQRGEPTAVARALAYAELLEMETRRALREMNQTEKYLARSSSPYRDAPLPPREQREALAHPVIGDAWLVPNLGPSAKPELWRVVGRAEDGRVRMREEVSGRIEHFDELHMDSHFRNAEARGPRLRSWAMTEAESRVSQLQQAVSDTRQSRGVYDLSRSPGLRAAFLEWLELNGMILDPPSTDTVSTLEHRIVGFRENIPNYGIFYRLSRMLPRLDPEDSMMVDFNLLGVRSRAYAHVIQGAEGSQRVGLPIEDFLNPSTELTPEALHELHHMGRGRAHRRLVRRSAALPQWRSRTRMRAELTIENRDAPPRTYEAFRSVDEVDTRRGEIVRRLREIEELSFESLDAESLAGARVTLERKVQELQRVHELQLELARQDLQILRNIRAEIAAHPGRVPPQFHVTQHAFEWRSGAVTVSFPLRGEEPPLPETALRIFGLSVADQWTRIRRIQTEATQVRTRIEETSRRARERLERTLQAQIEE